MRSLLWRLLGKGPDVAIVTFCTGPADLCRRMADEVRALVPGHKHFVVTEENWREIRPQIKPYRIGLAPVMLGRTHRALRRRLPAGAPQDPGLQLATGAPHLRPDLPSLLFLRGVPLDRIYLRPWWWPWPKRERSIVPRGYKVIEGRAVTGGRPRVAVLSPYLPYPLSHGGAVRIYNLLREIAREFDVELFAFRDGDAETRRPAGILRAHRDRGEAPLPRAPMVHVAAARSSRIPLPRDAQGSAEEKRAFGYEALQVEYTQLAEYAGDILVEHDVTFDLFTQIARPRPHTFGGVGRMALAAIREPPRSTAFARVVVMSEKDAEILRTGVVLENGVDLDRFRPSRSSRASGSSLSELPPFPEHRRLPFFHRKVWPLLRDKFPAMTVTVVCGPDYLTYWRAFADSPEPAPTRVSNYMGFVADVRPLYDAANLVLVPTTVSAGTNVKVLEAMAMRRAVVSTSSGCAGLGLLHGHSVWEADTPEAFAAGIATLIKDPEAPRQQIAEAAWLARPPQVRLARRCTAGARSAR